MSTKKFVRVQVVDASKVSGKESGYLIKDWDGYKVIPTTKFEELFAPGDEECASDGYHTFKELYNYRMLYNAGFANELAARGDIKICKSHRHSDGEECFGGGWFIVMIELPTGQISNHYENEYWDLFKVPEVETAWEWDGHTPQEAADRLLNYLKIK